ncbi:MAG: TldD/PmbA family protein, partial [Candidatus Lambdaproteobacteria bacterium]|nr:TldD/PmbA family protein [Candidatus Lambdaproteobacteria bacterium]
MLAQGTVEKIIGHALSKGADFAEVFAEESETSSIDLLDRKIDSIASGNSFGVGVRLLFGGQMFYGYSSDAAESELLTLTGNLAKAHAAGQPGSMAPLQARHVDDRHTVLVDPSGVPKRERVALLRQLDEETRRQGDPVRQVGAGLAEKKRAVLIANSEGLWVEDARQYARLRLSAIAEERDGPQSATESPGVLGGYEFFQGLDVAGLARQVAQAAIRMAGAGYIRGGMMPVVLGNGFGGVIFHEACGHPLETEAIRKDASPFAGKLGQPVAQPILTAIDDGTLTNHWGSLNVDDEGQPAQRTVLIEQGILRAYLSDRIGAAQVGVPRSGSARRESYKYAPVSRMRNTYIDRGPHRVGDMIASIDFGLYAKKMGGGSVNPATGEFNFSVQEGYAIRTGRIAEPVRGATLIGKGFEVLPRIS